MKELLSTPWPWYVGGPMIALTMFLLLIFGREFGVSSTLRTTCAAFGAGKYSDFFDFKWKNQVWNLVFVAGALLGGFIAQTWFASPEAVDLSQSTIARMESYNIAPIGNELVPTSLFAWDMVFTLKGFILIVIGGFLVGFGTRYAGGCTSGHAISGLSNLQLPSLIAVVGFFVGGLLVTFFVLPYIMDL